MQARERDCLPQGSSSEFYKYLQYLSFLALRSLVFLASYLFCVHSQGLPKQYPSYEGDARHARSYEVQLQALLEGRANERDTFGHLRSYSG